MRVLNWHDAAREYARAINKPLVLLHFDDWNDTPNYLEELRKAAPCLNFNDDMQAVIDGQAVIVCEDEAEVDRVFYSVVGDDGPTKYNPYNGPVRVYALTVGADGEFLNENT